MAAPFRRTHPGIPLVRGTGDDLPLATASLGFVTYAQACPGPTPPAPEALRVLRPGGARALWGNTDALDVPWIAAAAERTTRRTVRWSRRVPVDTDTHLANIGSHSVFLVHGEEHTASFLAAEREHLLRAFPPRP